MCMIETAVFPPDGYSRAEDHMLFSLLSQKHSIEAPMCFLALFGTRNSQTQTQGPIIGRTACFPQTVQ